ncbi:1-deoxy-D-xylulose-5-phosphate synthase [Planctomycetes bacterium Poly30]|uniref:1-deoxy-D-xylulose-5-phosphate synthase n=1 Tax=Saltatorellus ferox TaxID=2528018 RepID=A0A518F026_9BACT|nr:1-deoxy-D-xylulose-5-phosphate synthase [Planctomycetes bacterium Poly30]
MSAPPLLAPLATGEPKNEATRNAYGNALLELGEANPEIVVLDADLSGSTKTKAFSKAYPKRFFNMGVAEANMIGVAAGLASQGLTAFASSFAMFATGKAYEQIRQSVCVPNLNVKVCATHAGLTVGEDGKSHQMLEDVTLMRVIPNMKVMVPADAVEARQCIHAAAKIEGPVYVRLSRASTPIVFADSYEFVFGKAALLREGTDLAIIAMGVTVAPAMEAAEALAREGIQARVLNMSTIKPLDVEAITRAASDCGAILTVEEHQENGGLGDAVAQAVVLNHPVPMKMCAMHDQFGQSGTGDELLAHYGLHAAGITASAKELMKRKGA